MGVVLCNPFGQEAIRAHRAFRQLALMLARARFHVLRFDYSGTGDSAGASDEVSIKAWCSDIVVASDELRDTAEVRKVAWVGLRLGATLAALAAQKRRDVERLVAWDPIVEGRAYLTELHRLHEEFMKAEHPTWTPRRRGVDEMTEALGFPISPSLKSDILAIDLASSCELSAKKSQFIVSDETEAHRAWHAKLLSEEGILPPRITYKTVAASAWNSEAAMASSLVPMEALMAIVDSLTEGRP